MEKKYTLIETDEARDDINAALKAYGKYGKNTFDRFDSAIETVEEILQEAPFTGHIIDGVPENIRVRSIPKYPYAFYYRINDKKLEVLAFALVPERAGDETIAGLLFSRVRLMEAKEK
jgi:plasmid stabilization system protein ParE